MKKFFSMICGALSFLCIFLALSACSGEKKKPTMLKWEFLFGAFGPNMNVCTMVRVPVRKC